VARTVFNSGNSFKKCFDDGIIRWRKCMVSEGIFFEGHKINLDEYQTLYSRSFPGTFLTELPRTLYPLRVSRGISNIPPRHQHFSKMT
jgi:hypothetical protein